MAQQGMNWENAVDGTLPAHYGGLSSYVLGVSLISVSFCLLLWNEHRTAAITKALEQALSITLSIDSEDEDSPPVNITRLIHITGYLSSQEVVTDEVYGVSAAAVKLRRLVEMYQWVEKSNYRQYADVDEIGIEPDYFYESDWRPELVDSTLFTNFSCVNPSEFPVKSQDFTLKDVYVGKLRLSESLISKIDNYKALGFPELSEVSQIMHDGFLYIAQSGGTPEKPEVGDIRISFFVAGMLGPTGDKAGAATTGRPA